MTQQHGATLLDKVKDALGMGDDSADSAALNGDRDEGWAGVPKALYDTTADEEPSGIGRNPGPIGSARYEDGATPADLGQTDMTREEMGASEFGGAYGPDDTPMPTEAAWDRGEAEPRIGEADVDGDSKRPY